MSELQSFFEPTDQPQTSTHLPLRLYNAALGGELDCHTVRRWLAAGGSPDAAGMTLSLLECACASGRPANAEIVGLLCAAGANVEGPRGDGKPLEIASKYGAEATVRRLLRAGAPVNEGRVKPLHNAVMVNNWGVYRDPWSIAQAKRATALGHQGIVRMLLARGAEVDARIPDIEATSLHLAARLSGFVSLGVVKELLKYGSSLDAVDGEGYCPEEIARANLNKPIYTGDGMPANSRQQRRPGAVEAFLALLADVRAAGSFKRYVNAPRLDVVVLQALCAKGRAAPYRSSRLSPPVLARLFPTSTKSLHLPKEIFWRILSYWRTDRDP